MKLKELTNIKIIERQDKNLSPYYIIFNQNSNQEAYFCFKWNVKQGWEGFQNNWNQIQKIEFEYEENAKGNKVINILSHDQTLDCFV